MTSPHTITLDRWRALADRELARLASAPEQWDPPTADEVAIELARAFETGPAAERSPAAVERSRTIARHLASARPRTADLARALGARSPSGRGLSPGRTRALIAEHRARYQHTGPDDEEVS